MTLYVNGVAKKVELRNWQDDGWNCGYSPDFFYDLETNFVDGQDVTEKEYQDLIDFWADEVSRHNAGEETEIFGEYDGTEIVFFCDEL